MTRKVAPDAVEYYRPVQLFGGISLLRGFLFNIGQQSVRFLDIRHKAFF